MDKLTREVKEFAYQVGADIVGIAGKDCFDRLPSVRPDELLIDAQSVVVIAVRRNANIPLPEGATWNGQEHYVGRLALEMYALLRTSSFLEDKGFNTYPVTHHGHLTPQRDVILREAIKYLTVTPDGELEGTEEFERVFWQHLSVLSHMRLAEEAGLGEIGLCRMLITPRFGPRVVLSSIVTDAPLEPDSKLKDPVCKKDECNKCVEHCPSGAIQPYGFNLIKCMLYTSSMPSIEMIKRGDPEELERRIISGRVMVFPFEKELFGVLRTGKLGAGSCGMCVSACPVGKRH
jgi:epoxyqueuosine reductase QueG